MTRDEFDLWLANPVTRWVFAALEKARAQEQAEWMRISWGAAPPNGQVSPAALIELRTRHDAFGEVVANDFETWSIWNGDEPQRD